MPILNILLVFVVVGLLTWLAVQYIPMPEPIKRTMVIVIVILLVVWVLGVIGLLGSANPPVRFH